MHILICAPDLIEFELSIGKLACFSEFSVQAHFGKQNLISEGFSSSNFSVMCDRLNLIGVG